MKKKSVLFTALCLCAVVCLCGCEKKQEMLGSAELINLFNSGESDFSAVADAFILSAPKYLSAYLNGGTVEVYDKDGNTLTLTDEQRAVLLCALTKMETLVEADYKEPQFRLMIDTRVLSGTPVVEFLFRDIDNWVDSGFFYASEAVYDNCTTIKDNWYLFFYGLV